MPSDVAVLSQYRAQCSLIEKELQRKGDKEVNVSTVIAAQGNFCCNLYNFRKTTKLVLRYYHLYYWHHLAYKLGDCCVIFWYCSFRNVTVFLLYLFWSAIAYLLACIKYVKAWFITIYFSWCDISLDVFCFAGSEWDYVILSTVRSLPKCKIERKPTNGWRYRHLGFIVDTHQINVALTRARKGIIIIGKKHLF